MWTVASCLAVTLIVWQAQLTLADNGGSVRQQRQFLSPSYSSLYSLYLRQLNEDLYVNELSVARPLKISWNGQFDSEDDYVSEVQPRQNIFGLSNINSAINPFASFFNRLPNTFIRNPEASSLSNAFTACVDASGLDGICIPSLSCMKFGGRPSSSCGLGTVCCVNSISKCGGQVTLNNTYWRSPAVIGSGSTCGLTLTLDNNLVEQKRKICQVRLDFLSFTIEQPNSQTVCATDNFAVVGATNPVPTICGDNPNQHMYLNPTSSVTDLQLSFTFGQSSITRSWNIKISLLPCLASYLAPPNCLQYYTAASGTIRSFNWKDITAASPRQLANQNYKICFRTELVTSLVATRICYSQCAVSNGGAAFSLSTSVGVNQAQTNLPMCNNDFLLIPSGFDPTQPLTAQTNTWDRFCGRALNPLTTGGPVTVCSTVKGFSVTYRTNGDETVSATQDAAPPTVINTGFCLDFQQRTA